MRSTTVSSVLCVAFTTVAAAIDHGTWIEKDNMLVIEAEHGFPDNAKIGQSIAGNCNKQGCWKYENTHKGYDGSRFRGSGYMQWHGKNYHKKSGVGVVEYPIYINNPGNYIFTVHNFHTDPDGAEGNDVWVQMDGIKTTQGYKWDKAFSNPVARWTMITLFHHREDAVEYGLVEWYLPAGKHVLQVSGRSEGFAMDRFHLHQNQQGASDPNKPESERAGYDAAPAQAPVYITEKGAYGFTYLTSYDLWGHDLVFGKTAASVDDCAVLCTQTAGCKAFTWQAWGGCFPKSASGARKYVGGAVSGFLEGNDEWSGAPATYNPAPSTPEYTISFKGFSDGSAGCCRFDDGSEDGTGGDEDDYDIYDDITTEAGCEKKCESEVACKGYEVSIHNGCELHRFAPDFSSDNKGCVCKAKIETVSAKPAPPPNPPAPVPAPPANTNTVSFKGFAADSQGCCRFDDGSKDGSTGDPYDQMEDISSEAGCEAACKSDSRCMGYEVSNGQGCELHQDPPAFVNTNKGCICKMKIVAATMVTDTTATDESATNAPKPEAPPAGSSDDGVSFEGLNKNGYGCCRFENDGDSGDKSTYQLLSAVTDEDECANECKSNLECLGFEVSNHEGCELHTVVPKFATSNDNCICKKKVETAIVSTVVSTVAPTTDAPATDAPATDVPSTNATSSEVSFEGLNEDGIGCCRFEGGSPGHGTYTHIATVTKQAECEAYCLLDPVCMGYEVSGWEGCELHTMIPSFATSTDGCTCMKKITTDSSPTATTSDPCNTIKCGKECTGSCGWSKVVVSGGPDGTCISGANTNSLEEVMGDCPLATITAATPPPVARTEAPEAETPSTAAPTTVVTVTAVPATTVAPTEGIATEASSTAAPTTVAALTESSCELIIGVDYFGADIPGGMNLAADTADECGNICVGHSLCTHFTYIWGGCYLKTSNSGETSQPHGISGICSKVEKDNDSIEEGDAAGCMLVIGVDYYGADIPGGMNLAAGSADACGDICLGHSLCTHFTYIWGGCYLKTSGDGAQPQPSGISGACAKESSAEEEDHKGNEGNEDNENNEDTNDTGGDEGDDGSGDEKISSGCTIVFGVDYYGADIPGGMNLAADSADVCGEMCLGHSLCTHFTYIWGGCYLKSSNGGEKVQPNGISGICKEAAEEDEGSSGSSSTYGDDDLGGASVEPVGSGLSGSVSGSPDVNAATICLAMECPDEFATCFFLDADCLTLMTALFSSPEMPTMAAVEAHGNEHAVELFQCHRISTCQEAHCTREMSMDYFGFDIGSHDSASAEECSLSCIDEPLCSYYSFSYGKCFMKTSDEGKIYNPGVISGSCVPNLRHEGGTWSKVCSVTDRGFDFSGGEVQGPAMSQADTADICGDRCQEHEECTHFTFAYSTCYLKTNADGRYMTKNAESGTCTWQLVEDDSCIFHNDGKCDEHPVCETGTDASDCNPSTTGSGSGSSSSSGSGSIGPAAAVSICLATACPNDFAACVFYDSACSVIFMETFASKVPTAVSISVLENANAGKLFQCYLASECAPETSSSTTTSTTTSTSTTTPSTTAVETTPSTTAVETTTGEPVITYIGLNPGGVGCCRVAEGSSGEFTLLGKIKDADDCADECTGLVQCTGFEVSKNGCELHHSELSYATMNSFCECYKKNFDGDGSFPTSPYGPPVSEDDDDVKPIEYSYEQLSKGCCRSSENPDNGDTSIIYVPNVEGDQACSKACDANESCLGFETNNWKGCELHTFKPDSTSGTNGCKCFVKGQATKWLNVLEQPEFSTEQPQTLSADVFTKLGDGCCVEAGGRTPSWLTWLPGYTYSLCEYACKMDPHCRGFEHKNQASGNFICKLTDSFISGSNQNDRCSCYIKN